MADEIVIDSPFQAPHAAGTPIEWYLSRMAASGITERVADLCGFRLKIDDGGAFFTIPYFDVDGIQTTFQRQRNREEQRVVEGPQSGGNFKGKYTQPKRSKNRVYWPPVVPQRLPFNNPLCPLIVCEGELKSVACKMALQASGLEALVCGVPGTKLSDSVIADLKVINMMGAEDKRRVVFIAMDWNGKGKSRENSLELEFQLRKLFQELGARCVVLRWDVADDAGEQKLDDWLVAGGDIGAAMRHSVEQEAKVDTEISAIWEYLNANYAIMHGYYVPLRDHKQKYTPSNLSTMEPQCRLQVSAKKFLSPPDVWNLQPNEDRNIVLGYTFVPAPLGLPVERYVWEDGKRLLNTAPETHWLAPPWQPDEPPDVSPFLDLIGRLCQDGAEWFLDFLAHCAQFPSERGPHIVIFKDDGGTGKSRLFETLDEVFGKYSGPIGDALTSSFNAELEHLILAWWSDPVIKGANDRDLESALKNFSGDSRIMVNHKGGAKYPVRVFGRLLIGTNKDWVVPVSTRERRFSVFGGLETMSYVEAGKYMKWLMSGGAQLIREFLVYRDLSSFDIHAPGPRTAQREEMERLSAPPIVRMLGDEPFDSKDIWSTEEIRRWYKELYGRSMSPDSIGRELARMGAVKRLTRVDKQVVRLNAIRNYAKWEALDSKDWAEEWGGAKY